MKFFKYQGTGNDFIIIDDRQERFPLNNHELIARLCDRHFGIGADGLILLRRGNRCDFRMVYFNSDGHKSSMCGNGGRCIVAFAAHIGIVNREARFEAMGHDYYARILPDGRIDLLMSSIDRVFRHGDAYILNTGSPHFVRFIDRLDNLELLTEAQAIRYSADYKEDGINVNFVERTAQTDRIRMRTYERGVENETLSCGTGMIAAAVSTFLADKPETTESQNGSLYTIETKGGSAEVSFDYDKGKFENVRLIGPAMAVFDGDIAL